MTDNQDFRDLILHHWKLIITANEMKDELSGCQDPIQVMTLQSDLETIQRWINETETMIAFKCGFKRLWETNKTSYMGAPHPWAWRLV